MGSRGAAEEMGARELDDIAAAIVDAAFHIHRDLGPGLLESVYEVVHGDDHDSEPRA
jgi:iron complex transport system substrate-binding protein